MTSEVLCCTWCHKPAAGHNRITAAYCALRCRLFHNQPRFYDKPDPARAAAELSVWRNEGREKSRESTP
jgi:hypothetical protein